MVSGGLVSIRALSAGTLFDRVEHPAYWAVAFTGASITADVILAIGLLAAGAVVLVLRHNRAVQDGTSSAPSVAAPHMQSRRGVTAILGATALVTILVSVLVVSAARPASADTGTAQTDARCTSVVVGDVIAGDSSNVLPGRSSATMLTLTNPTSTPLAIALSSVTTNDSRNLGAVSTWSATDGKAPTVRAALSDSTPRPFTTIPAGSKITVTITVGIDPNVGNTYQGAHADYRILATASEAT